MVQLVEDFGPIGFETLAVEVSDLPHPVEEPDLTGVTQDKTSMLTLLRVLDRANGHVYGPTTSADSDDIRALMGEMGMQDLGDVDDVQERWIDRRGEYDEAEREAWKREGEMRAAADARQGREG